MLLVGIEPEEESPIIFLRLRKAAFKGQARVISIAPFATRGLNKLLGRLIADRARAPRLRSCRRWPTTPRCPRRLVLSASSYTSLLSATAAALAVPGAVIVVGERLAGAARGVVGRGGSG